MQIATPMAEALGRYLDLSSLELKLTAENMANVDTPGYRTVGFDFAAEMQRSLEGLSQAPGGASGDPAVGPVGGCWSGPTATTSRWTGRA